MKSASAQALRGIFEINNANIVAVYKDLKPEHFFAQVDGIFSPISWQAGHLVSTRFSLAKALGIDISNVKREIKDQSMYSKAFDATKTYDSMEIKNDWDTVTALITERLNTITEEEFTAPYESPMPTPDKTPRGIMAFLMWHESYHLGQMGGLRKAFGYTDLASMMKENNQAKQPA